MFNPVTYFENLTNTLKLTAGKYMFRKVDGLDDFEGVIKKRNKSSYFIAVDVTENGAIQQGASRSFFDRRPTTVFICAACAYSDLEKKETLLQEFRSIHRAFLSKMLKDKSEDGLLLLDLSRVPYYEMPAQFASGMVGIYFMIFNDEPKSLVYDPAEWQ